MPPKTPKKAIRDTLANLTGDNLKRFCEELLDRREEPRVKRNMVDGKSYLDVVNVLVDNYTEAKAPGVAEELLREIGCSNDADDLAREISSQSQKPGSSDKEHFVDKHRVELIERVSNVASIMDVLLSKEVISPGDCDEILAIPTKRGQMRKLYSGPLHAAGRNGKEVFYELLKEKEKYLIAELKKTK